MQTIRLIDVSEDNRLTWTSEKLNTPIQGKEAAFQRIMLGLINRPGSLLSKPSFGSPLTTLKQTQRSESSDVLAMKVGDHIANAKQSILQHEPTDAEYIIDDLTLIDVSRREPRGINIELRVTFTDFHDTQILLPTQPPA